MGYYAEDQVGKVQDAIHSKGELYSIDLYPDQAVANQAREDFNAFQLETPAMQAIGNDMRSFYGLGQQTQATADLAPQQAPASPAAPVRVQAKERAQAHLDTNQYDAPAGPQIPDISAWEQKLEQENNSAALIASLGLAGLAGAGVSKAAEPSDEEIIQRYLDSL